MVSFLIEFSFKFISYNWLRFFFTDDCGNDDCKEMFDNESEEMTDDQPEEGNYREEPVPDIDSDATISDDEAVPCGSDTEEEDSDLVMEDWANRPASGRQKKQLLSDFENDFAKMYLAGKFSEAQGDMIIELVRKHNASIKTRKPKALVNHLVNVAFDHYHYVECDCGLILKKTENKFFCSKCSKQANINTLANYVAFNMEEQLRIISKQLPDIFCGVRDSLTLRLFVTSDAIPISDSSNVELLPVIVYIENIENHNLRCKCFLVAAVALLNKKTKDIQYNPMLLLQTFLNEFQSINTNGVETYSSKQTRLEITAFLGDNPCRSKFLNVQQHNGTCPCHRCYIEKPKNEHLPVLQSFHLKAKTKELAIEHAQSVESIRKKGTKVDHEIRFKGRTILEQFGTFDFVQRTPDEIMHCLFLGVVKNSLKAFISALSANERTQIDQRIAMLKPPSNSKRSIRPLIEFANYKSSEFEMIFFYYGFFIFKGILPKEPFSLLMFLSSATFKLWSRNATTVQVEEAKYEIDHFMYVMKEFLRRSELPSDLQTYNLHCLLHLHEDRINFGPLCRVNAYGYENQLQHFKNIFISKNRRLESLVRKIKTEKMLPIQVKDEAVKFMCATSVEANIQEIIMNCSRIDQRQFAKAKFYQALDWGFLKITCFDYSKRKNNCDSFIKLQDGNFYLICKIYDLDGEILLLEKFFLHHSHPEITLAKSSTSLLHIHPVSSIHTGEFIVKPIDYIEKQVSFINLDKSLSSFFSLRTREARP